MLDKYTWIRTRDGSLTLWSNELGEPFRSTRGAFTESWNAFVKPAMEWMKANSEIEKYKIGEFGLGIGTNYLLFSLAATAEKIPFQYYAIEKNVGPFIEAKGIWYQASTDILKFLSDEKISVSEKLMADTLENSFAIYPTLEDALAKESALTHVWFHDPFGASVNPEGYEKDTLNLCQQLWHPKKMAGFSYACNRPFQAELKELQMQVVVRPTDHPFLKRERLEFFRH